MKEQFLKELRELEILKDYVLIISSDRYPSFKYQNGDRIMTIGTGDLHEMKMHSIGCHLLFKSIETHFQALSDDWTADLNPTVKQFTHSSLVYYEFGKNIYSKLPQELCNESDVKLGLRLLKEFVVNDALPFFNYWKDIRVFLPWLQLENNDFMGMSQVFGNDAVLKKCIVWYHTNHPEYENFAIHHENRLKALLDKQPKNAIVKKGLKKLNKINKDLKRLPPLFEWEDDYLTINPFKPSWLWEQG